MVRIGVLVSGSGTNLQAIIDAIQAGKICNGEISLVVADRPGAYALERAAEHGIPGAEIARKDASSLDDFNEKLIKILTEKSIDLVILAGFLSILNHSFITAFPNRIMNIHPALIPSFCGKGYYGLKVHEEVIQYGVKVTGATVHFVNDDIDGGPIILQKAIDVPDGISPEELQKKVMQEAEWIILPEAIDYYCNNRLEVSGRQIRISGLK